ncbi:MAG: Uma2 family endonuclease [Planctomycetota bacterium]
MSVIDAPSTDLTLDQFVDLPDSDHMELIDGAPVEKLEMGYLERSVQLKVGRYIDEAQDAKPIGIATVEGLVRINPNDPKRGRRPDVAFVTFDRLGDRPTDAAYIDVCPEICVEIVSPNDTSFEVAAKIAEYLAAGAKLVWEVQREQRYVMVHRPDGNNTRLGVKDTLTGEDVLPNFSVAVKKLFG